MKLLKNLIISVLVLGFMFNSNDLKSADGDLKIGTVSYLSYETQLDSEDGLKGGNFKLNRTYLTFKKQLLDYLGFRITVDSRLIDGNMTARLKYAYADFKFGDFLFFTKTNLEFGMVHTPWMDFEQATNRYRMQGKMFLDKNGLNSSADLGATFGGYFGGEMDDEYKKKVNKKYAGKYGSFQVGVYNGGGYDATEVVDNKAFEGRVTIRPLPEFIPGLQLSYFGVFGKGNQFYDMVNDDDEIVDNSMDSIPDMQVNAAALSYEHEYFTFIGQYVAGQGNKKGKLIDEVTKEAAPVLGYSAFLELKPIENWKAIFRYDSFDENTDIDDNEKQSIIAGIGYDFGGGNILILDFDKTMYANEGKDDKDLIKLTMQIKF